MLNEENMFKHIKTLSDETIDRLTEMLWISRLNKDDRNQFEEMIWKEKFARSPRNNCFVHEDAPNVKSTV